MFYQPLRPQHGSVLIYRRIRRDRKATARLDLRSPKTNSLTATTRRFTTNGSAPLPTIERQRPTPLCTTNFYWDLVTCVSPAQYSAVGPFTNRKWYMRLGYP